MSADNPRFVTTITPQRISFAGGGTDFPDFYLKNGGAVVSATIDKFVYVTVKRHSELFREKYRLSYSQTEHVDDIELIENDIARECLRFLNVDPPLFISTTSDLPVSSGLGSSSSFAVGLLLVLHARRGETVTAGQLAEEACHIEINILGKSIGKQVSGVVVATGYASISDSAHLASAEVYLKHHKILLLDRDGTLNIRPKRGEYFNAISKFKWIEASRDALKIFGKKGFSFIIILNQAGVSTGETKLEDLNKF